MKSKLSLAAALLVVLGFSSSISALDRVPAPPRDPADLGDFVPPEKVIQPVRFLRGDVDGSGDVAMADAIKILSHLFLDGRALGCDKAADADDNGDIGIGDAVRVLNFLFSGNVGIPGPFPECGEDLTADGLTCESSGMCGAEVRSAAFQMTPVKGGYLVDLPEVMARAIPDGAEVSIALGGARVATRSISGLATRVSEATLLFDTDQRLDLAVKTGLTMRVAVHGAALLSTRQLDFTCGPRTCVCSGDPDCNDLFSGTLCGPDALCITDSLGGVWCICIRS